jgi:hypothetical protein
MAAESISSPALGGGERDDGERLGRREVGGGHDMWAPHIRTRHHPVSVSCMQNFIWVMECGTSREPICKFRDSYVYFGSLWTQMTPHAKFMYCPCILLLCHLYRCTPLRIINFISLYMPAIHIIFH